ncbi:Uncharacterised protein [Enterobacter cloacae]|nr:Uncharacterised protein [Enterobacter cloacae]
MRITALHPLFGNCPDCFAEIDFAPSRIGQFTFANHG